MLNVDGLRRVSYARGNTFWCITCITYSVDVGEDGTDDYYVMKWREH